MAKKVQFFIDDVIWVFRDLTRQRPASMFDHPFLNMLKTAHDRYGMKTQLNCFYRTSFYYGHDEFNLSMMTDAYKAEWEAASDWLKLTFHSWEEFPDYPYLNASYETVKHNFTTIAGEIKRFAGEKTLALGIVPHWAPISREGAEALRDCGIKVLYTTCGKKTEYDGNMDSLPYGHAQRLLHNRKPETMLYTRTNSTESIARSICGYNHITDEENERMRTTLETMTDPATGLKFKSAAEFCVNIPEMDELCEMTRALVGNEFIMLADHEQYFYPEYFAYQPDHAEKVYAMAEILYNAGYEFIFMEEMA